MKFFIRLSYRYDNHGNQYSHMDSVVYGPYEDDKTVEDALALLWPNDKEKQFLVFDGQILNVKPSSKEKPEEKKRTPGNMENYYKERDIWKCKDCNADILGTPVTHLIWIPGMIDNNRSSKNETDPYCPNCEKNLNSHGAPII